MVWAFKCHGRNVIGQSYDYQSIASTNAQFVRNWLRTHLKSLTLTGQGA
jgi:hypothetical protein